MCVKKLHNILINKYMKNTEGIDFTCFLESVEETLDVAIFFFSGCDFGSRNLTGISGCCIDCFLYHRNVPRFSCQCFVVLHFESKKAI